MARFRALELVVFGGARHEAGDVWRETDPELAAVWRRLAEATPPMVAALPDDGEAGVDLSGIQPPPFTDAPAATTDVAAPPTTERRSRRSSRRSRRR